VLVGSVLVLALSFAFVTPAKADLLSDLQAQVQALLAQISALSGSTTTTAGAGCYAFTRTHQQGDSGGEVMWIQKFLNSHGAQVAASGAGSPGNETSYYGALTKAAVAKWQAANGVSPAAGYWGPITRARVATVCAGSVGIPGPGIPGVPGVPVTGNGLKVMLAADSPPSTSLVAGQAAGELAKFTLVNPTGSEVTVTSLGFKRIGTSADSTVSNVYLFKGSERITDSAGISSSMFTFNDTAGVVKVPAGGSVTVSVRADIAASTGGEQIGAQLVSVGSAATLDTSVVLPISGAIHLISSASMGTIAFTYTGPTGATDNPANDVRVFEASTVVSTHSAWLKAITFENRGSSDDNDIKNLRLYVDGTQVGSIIGQLSNNKAVFDLSGSPVKLETGTRIVKVVADIVGGSSKTYDIQIRRAADLLAVDSELNQPVLATDAGGSFPVSAATANTIGTASLSVVRKADSPSTNVAVGATNLLLARYEVRASGENVKIEAMTVDADTSVSVGGVDNGKVFFNGQQVGSTKDIVEAGTTEFTFGSSLIARQGQTEIIEIYADAKTTTGTNLLNNETVAIDVTISTSNTEGMDSGDAVTSANLSASAVAGFTRTVSSSSLTLTKNSAYGNQTVVAGTNNVKMGSFTLSAGSTEGVNVNTVTVTLLSSEASTITDMRLVDNSTGTQIGTTKGAPSTSNSFSVNFTVPVSGTKTIDIYANVKSGISAGIGSYEVDGSGVGAVTATSVTFGSSTNEGSGTLQSITIATAGSLTSANGVSPDDTIVVAGSTMARVGTFNFTALNSDYTIQELKVKVTPQAATSIGAVYLKYKNQAGTDVTNGQALTLSSGTQVHATATYTGLTFFVPMNTSKSVDVYVDVPTITSGATAGTSITALLDWNDGFKAVDAAGNSTTTMSSYADLSSTNTSGKGTLVVRKTVPTLSAVALDTTTLSEGTDKVLGRVKVTADAAGDVDWGQFVFTVNKTSAISIGATTTLALWDGSTQIAGSFATTTGALVGALDALDNLTTGLLHFRPTTVRTVAADTSATYELRGTIGGTASGANFVDVSIANPSTSVTTAIFSTAAGTLGTAANASFVWSDWSDLSDHAAGATSASTADWTNDYLVDTLPLTIGNKSVSI